jgi:hypothetical protein
MKRLAATPGGHGHRGYHAEPGLVAQLDALIDIGGPYEPSRDDRFAQLHRREHEQPAPCPPPCHNEARLAHRASG